MLNKKEIESRLKTSPPMVDNIKDINLQLQPTGLDLTLKDVYMFGSPGHVDFDNSKRKLPEMYKLSLHSDNYYLKSGCYQVLLNETFNMPLDVAGFTISRSSLQRCGAAILTGFFDPGFTGNGVSLLEVYNPNGLYLYPDARICQMAFHTTNETESYSGIYNSR